MWIIVILVFFIFRSTLFNIFLHSLLSRYLLPSSSSLFFHCHLLPAKGPPPTPVPPSSWSCRRPFILLAPTSSSSFVTPPHHDIEHHKPPSARDHRIALPSVRHYSVVVSFLRTLQHSGQPPSCALSSSRAPHCQDPSPTARFFSPSPLALFLIVTAIATWKPLRASLLLSYTRRKHLHHTHTIRSGARCLPKPLNF